MDLLLELFSEEIPARMQTRAAEDLKKLVTNGLVEAGLTYESAGAFSTPRRLVLSIEGLVGESPTLREERKGPRTDAPEKALEGFLRSVGLTKDQLEVRDDKKGQVYFASIVKAGRKAEDIAADIIPAVIRNFPWPKSMRWGDGSLRWVRPLHSILCLASDEAGPRVIPFDIDGIASGNSTQGHRFMAPAPFTVSDFEDYAQKLRRAFVVLSSEDRAEHISHDAEQLAFAQGLELVEDKGLLAEVAGLVEWPVVLMGDIGADFLSLPPEVLQTSMREHQKFFSVRNPKSGRIEKYITVANRETADNGATILAGNGKVLAARLSDAKFFWENDLRTIRSDFSKWLNPLALVTFHSRLGTQAERINRIAPLSKQLAEFTNADKKSAERAARIAKADLSSEMVFEFPELQGTMGKYYALEAGEPYEIADACEMHYSPLGPSDVVPSHPVSSSVALADKLDMLIGFWLIDERPTGSKDPFALRRAALGVIRICIENGIRLKLSSIISAHAEKFAKYLVDFYPNPDDTREADEQISAMLAHIQNLPSFFADRLKVHLRDEGIRHDIIDACFQLGGQDDLVLLVNRVKALHTFLTTEDGANLLTGYKRANNILQAEEKKDGVEYSLDPQPRLAEQPQEKALFTALDQAEAAIAPALAGEDFEAAMTAMARLRAPIDAFFDHVTVNADSDMTRRNRLCLLNRIRTIMNQVAIFSAIEG